MRGTDLLYHGLVAFPERRRPTDPVDLMETAVIVYFGQAALKLTLAPVNAVADEATERIRSRLRNVRHKAAAKSGGAVVRPPDRVAFKALTEAAITDDEVAADYLGGVLAASGPENDEATPIIALIGRLSSYQLRFHYIVYRELHRLWPLGPGAVNFYAPSLYEAVWVKLPGLQSALGEEGQYSTAFSILEREGLIGSDYHYGYDTETHGYAALVHPTPLGAEFFLAGHGAREIDANLLVGGDVGELTFLADVPATPNASLILPGDGKPAR